MILPKLLRRFKKANFIWSFFIGAWIGAIILWLALTLMVFWVRQNYRQQVYPNISIFRNSVSGRTKEELEVFLKEKQQEISQRKLIFLWQDQEEKRWEITPGMIDFSLDEGRALEKIWSFGRSEQGLANLIEIYQLLLFPQEVSPIFSFSEDKLVSLVAEMVKQVYRPVQDALFEFKGGRVLNFQASKEGRQLDQEQTKKLILLAFERNEWEKTLLAIELPVQNLQPKVTTSETNQLGIKEFLGEGESFFHDSIPSRVHNIALASSLLHGIVIPPGEVFSFSQKIGDISAATGYQQAYVIRERKTILEDGGGVCQVSTTLFRAALAAGLPIVERQPHYYRVGFYEQGGYPPGLDATVYPPSPDLKFKNDTQAYLLVQTKFDQNKKRLAFEFYGTSDGRRTEVSKPIIHSQTPPPEAVYVDDPDLASGVIQRVDTSHWGAKVSFTRKVWSADGSLKEEQTFWSNYTAWAAVYRRGIRQ